MKRQKWTFDNTAKKSGRPPKAKATEELVVRLAAENPWGYVRIAGELRKLGHDVSASYVLDLLKRHGFPPGGRRGGLSWKMFIQAHLDVTWAADFFTEEVWTCSGLVTYYALFFIHLGSRRVHFGGCTPQPDAVWMRQQARNLSVLVDNDMPRVSYLIHDRDTAFLPLDSVLRAEGVKVIRTPPQAPMCNAYAERFVRETRETLDNMILLGEPHFRHVLNRVEWHHNQHRPHQGLGNVIPMHFEYPSEPAPIEAVRCESSLGGLLNHYYVGELAA